LARVPLAGGAPREILDNIRDADWAPSGDNLAVVRAVGSENRVEFPVGHVLFESHGRPAQGSAGRPAFLRVSPKGNSVAFFNYDAELGDFSVMLVELNGQARMLSRGWSGIGGLGWSPKGDEIWFGATRPGEDAALWAVSLTGKERLLMQTPVFVVLDDVARDGRVLVVSSISRINIAYVASDAKEERDLSWLDTSRLFEISADGKTVLFNELSYGQGRNPAIYLRKTDGSPAVRLGDGAHPSLSPDGKWVLCKRKEGVKSELVILPTGAGDVRSLTTPGMEYESAEWFPDGKRVLFSGNESGHSFRTYVQEVDGGKPTPVTAEGKSAACVSPDQKVAVSTVSNKLSLQPLSGGEPRAVAEIEPGDAVLRWSEDGKFLFLLRREGAASASILRLNIASGKIEMWRQLRPPDPVGVSFFSASVTPDGRSYAYSFQRELTNLYLGAGLK
jgi:Tol biopolymer transport system component